MHSTFVIGKDSWDDNLDRQTEELKAYVNKGGRIICLEQNQTTFNSSWLPVKVKFLEHSNNDPVYLSPSLAYKDGMNINLERPYHPIFSVLNPRMFRLWADYTSYDESKNGFPAIYPVNTGYELQSSSIEDVAILANYSRALAGTALSELFMGKGSILLSIFINLHLILRQFFLSFWNDRNRIHHQTVTWSINYPSFRGIVSPNNGIVYGYILFMLLIDRKNCRSIKCRLMNMDINMQAPTEAGIRNRECNMSHTADVRWLHLLSHVEVAPLSIHLQPLAKVTFIWHFPERQRRWLLYWRIR